MLKGHKKQNLFSLMSLKKIDLIGKRRTTALITFGKITESDKDNMVQTMVTIIRISYAAACLSETDFLARYFATRLVNIVGLLAKYLVTLDSGRITTLGLFLSANDLLIT